METLDNLVGNQEDWANFITNVEMRETPFLDWLPVGDKPVNALFNYQADAFRAARVNSHVDGQPWANFNSAGDKRGRLKALIQWFDNGVSVSRLTQDVTNIAGVEDELAREIPKCLKEMATDMEAAFQDDQDGREDDKTQGYLTRGVGSWISSTAQALYPVATAFLTPAASIDTTAIASQTEDGVRNMLASMWRQCKSKEEVTGFVGETLKRKFSDFQFYVPSSTTTTANNTFNQLGKDMVLQRAIDTYKGDFMPVNLVLQPWLVTLTGTASAQKGRGHFLHRSKWQLRWNSKPKVYKPEFKGGSYEAAMDAIVMLVCKNPQGEGKLNPA
jgi:hypothetical protein